MLTGCPPFRRPDLTLVWFKAIWSGKWLDRTMLIQQPASVYKYLSPNALDLIDKMITPQAVRLNIQEVLNHNWFKDGHAGNKVPLLPL
jgi:hypothetical protein